MEGNSHIIILMYYSIIYPRRLKEEKKKNVKNVRWEQELSVSKFQIKTFY